MKYCTYMRFTGIFGWLHGWTLIGISDEPRISGYAGDFMHLGCKIMLLEIEPPLPPQIRFIPKGAKKIQHLTTRAMTIPIDKE